MAEYISPIDGHRHFGDQGQAECAVCCLEAERDRLVMSLEEEQEVGSEAVVERDRLRERLDSERRHRIAAVDREVETRNERDRFQAAFDRIALDPAEYRHALSHVADCDYNCEQCRDLARQALDGGVDAQERAADILTERDQSRASAVVANYAADAAAEAIGAMAVKLSALLAENRRLRAVVDAAQRWHYLADQDTTERDLDRATDALGEAVERFEQLGSSPAGEDT